MTEAESSKIIRMAWEDRTTFDEIFEKTGLAEADVIKLMRTELKASSFRMWRKRVSGRITKHRKPFSAATDLKRERVEFQDEGLNTN